MQKTGSDRDDQKYLETAMLAGHILLKNRAEIVRVEETMERMTKITKNMCGG